MINLINFLNLNKSEGHDNISPYFLRIAFSVLSPTLCYFIENATKFGIFPLSCKIAKVVPLFKSGEKDNLTNYRPIPILTCFSKIFENLIYSRLFAFFQKDVVPIKTQYGFRNNKSTTHAILDILINNYDNIDTRKYTALILLDFKKAFDTVCHSILLKKT